MFQLPQQRVSEKCSCGATFVASGPLSTSSAYDWRHGHPCPNRIVPRWPKPAAKSVSSQPKNPH